MNSSIEPVTPSPVVSDRDAILFAAHLLGDTWALLIVNELLLGSRRFGELHEALDKISSQTLTNRLKMLEKYEFLQREAFAEIPPRVEYRLTEKGFAVADILKALTTFGRAYYANKPEGEYKPPVEPSC